MTSTLSTIFVSQTCSVSELSFQLHHDMSERPRRSARQPPRYQQLSPPPATPISARTKRKAQDVDPADQLHYLLQDPKSTLTTIDITVRWPSISSGHTTAIVLLVKLGAQQILSPQDLINASSWGMLSPESQAALKALLPPTAFHGFQSNLEPSHPSAAADSMVVDQPSGDVLDIAVFTDPHFLAASRTFQDHIYSDWMSDAHKEKVNKFQVGIRDGTLAAPWKDEVWEKDNRPSKLKSIEKTSSFGNIPESAARAGYVTIPISICTLTLSITIVRLPKSGLSHWQRTTCYGSVM